MSALGSAFAAGFIRGLTALPPARRRRVRGRIVAAVTPPRPRVEPEPVAIPAAPALKPPPSPTVTAAELWPTATVAAAGLDPFFPLDSDDLDWLREHHQGGAEP